MRPNPNTVIANKKIADIIEQVLNGKEVSIVASKSQRSMLDRVARESGSIKVTTKLFISRTTNSDVKEVKLFKKKAFFLLSFDFALIGFSWALVIQLFI